MALSVFWPSVANACSQYSDEDLFRRSDVVLVGVGEFDTATKVGTIKVSQTLKGIERRTFRVELGVEDRSDGSISCPEFWHPEYATFGDESGNLIAEDGAKYKISAVFYLNRNALGKFMVTRSRTDRK